MGRYPSIGDHGPTSDRRAAALVAADGALDWLCCPRSGSPSVFASVLDPERGGHYRVAPDRDDYVSSRLYLPDTAILVTRFVTADGAGEVRDFVPVTGAGAAGRDRLVRSIRVVRGVMRFVIEIQPRFDYGRKPHELEICGHGAVFAYDGLELTVHGIAPGGCSLAESGITLERVGDGLRWAQTLREGECGGVVLDSMAGAPRGVSPGQAQQMAEDTARFWRGRLADQARAVLAGGPAAGARGAGPAVLGDRELAMLAGDLVQGQEAAGRLGLQLARACLASSEVAAARQLLREIDDILTGRPAPGTLPGRAGQFGRTPAAAAAPGMTVRVPLTPAELRLLPYLQTHLTAAGIAGQLFLSSHTVKAEIKSIYRKLGVSSRDDAVQTATAIGLLDA
jgi:DNA-binding CsgD family transcriptional regulator